MILVVSSKARLNHVPASVGTDGRGLRRNQDV